VREDEGSRHKREKRYVCVRGGRERERRGLNPEWGRRVDWDVQEKGDGEKKGDGVPKYVSFFSAGWCRWICKPLEGWTADWNVGYCRVSVIRTESS
jgi:hypothetical protein